MAEYGKSITRPSRRSKARSSHFWLKIIGASLTLLIGVVAFLSLPKRSSETHPRVESLSSEATHRVSIDANQLVSMLMESDEHLKPKATTLEDGSTQYSYTKRSDEPIPTVQDLQSLIDNPKDRSRHQQEIRLLLQRLKDLGVAVVFDHQLNASVG